MTPPELLEALVELAGEVGFEVRNLPRPDPDLPVRSGACLVRGRIWLWLAPGDPLEDRIDATARALRENAGPALEDRYLAPALRERLEADA